MMEPEEFMGLSGPLVTIYETLLFLYENEIMRDRDWLRGESLTELDNRCMGAEAMYRRIQATRYICLGEIAEKLSSPEISDDILAIRPKEYRSWTENQYL